MTVVREIMTRQLFSSLPAEKASDALDYLMMLNIHAAPVVDETTQEPVGMIALSDLTGDLTGETVEGRMSRPAAFVVQTAPVGEAARVIAHTGFHHLVVVDGDHRAVGFVSAIDVIRSQQGWTRPGAPAAEAPPAAAPQLEWSAQQELTETGVLAAPEGPGVVVLLRVSEDLAPIVLWAQSTGDLRTLLSDLHGEPPPRLLRYLERGQLYFRAALVPDPDERREALLSLLRGSVHLEAPGQG
ncbi:MAG: CBS domain-containing protein [Myxococcales bacterium]|nr:CBS domain-containing protein [Myxococcales bacterium]